MLEFTEQTRILLLVAACVVLWSAESLIPLYADRRQRLRHALPNIALAFLLVATNAALSYCSARISAYSVDHRIGLLAWTAAGTWVTIAASLLGLDLSGYAAHVSLHKLAIGWRFHLVHHSERQVDVTTAFRQHPVETIWRILWQMGATAILGIPLWIVVIYLVLSALNAQLEHANIRMHPGLDAWLRLVFVTPDMHKAHHSRRQQETDSNYSNIFSFWDRIFGTYTGRIGFGELRYGLDGYDGPEWQTFTGLLRLPFLRQRS